MRQFTFLVFILMAIFSIISCASGESTNQSSNANDDNLQISPTVIDVSSDTEVIDLKIKLESNPDDPETNYILGLRYLQLGRTDLARDVFARSLKVEPSNVDYQIANANTYADEGKIAEAEDLFTEILATNENNTDVLVSWGVMYYNFGLAYEDDERIKSAEDKFNQVIDIDSDNLKAHFNLGLIHTYRNEVEMAKDEFETVHKLEPERISAIKHLLRISFKNEDWDLCREYSRKGLEIDDEPQFVYYLARVAYEKKEYEEAEELFEKYLGMEYMGSYEADARARLFEIKGL